MNGNRNKTRKSSAKPQAVRTAPQRKQRKKKTRSTLLMAVLIAILVLIALFLIINNVYVIRNVIIEGDVDLNTEEVVRLAGLSFGSSIRSVREEQIRQNIEGTGEYILVGISIQRPNTVILALERRVPVAITFTGGKYLLLDKYGYVTRIYEQTGDEVLPFIKGLNPTNYRLGRPVSVSEEQLSAYTELMRALLEQRADTLIRELDLTEVKSVTAESRIGVTVRFGDITAIDDKIVWMKAALMDLEERGDSVGVLDVSSGNQAQWRAS